MATAIQANLASNPIAASPPPPDPFLGGLYDGSPELGTEAEAILTAEIESSSGLSWKK